MTTGKTRGKRRGWRGLMAAGLGLALLGLPAAWGLAAEQGGIGGGLVIQAPREGDLLARVQALWAQTLPIVQADAAAGGEDAWYQARRKPLFTAWVMLQAVPEDQAGVGPAAREAIARLIPRVLELVDHVYGFPGYSQAKREQERANQGRTRYLIKDIENKLAGAGRAGQGGPSK